MLSVAIIAAGGWLIMRDQLDYRDLITFSLYVTTFINPIRKLANFSELFANGFAGLHRFAELMRTKPSIVDAPLHAAETCAPEGEICLEHVGFSYDGELPVLRMYCCGWSRGRRWPSSALPAEGRRRCAS